MFQRKLNKKALSPLIATILLVVFSLIIGAATMSWGKNYVKEMPSDTPKPSSYISINMDEINNPLKELQIRYLTGKITLEEYLQQEAEAIQQTKSKN